MSPPARGTGARRRSANRGSRGSANADPAPPKSGPDSARSGSKKAGTSKASAGTRTSTTAPSVSSMTGFGKTTLRSPRYSGWIEVRSFNHRYLKLSLKTPSYLQGRENEIEKILRQRMRRGSVSLTVKLALEDGRTPFEFDDQVIAGYVRELRRIKEKHDLSGEPSLELVTGLADALIPRDADDTLSGADWKALRDEIVRTVDRLVVMRQNEGRKLRAEIVRRRKSIEKRVKVVEKASPRVARFYHERLKQRMRQLEREVELELDEAELAREVALFADRCDISEEVARMYSHLSQFDEIVESGNEVGRRLEFILHEMFREINTIGSKANDADIAREVVEAKAEIERIREQVQNIE